MTKTVQTDPAICDHGNDVYTTYYLVVGQHHSVCRPARYHLHLVPYILYLSGGGDDGNRPHSQLPCRVGAEPVHFAAFQHQNYEEEGVRVGPGVVLEWGRAS